MDKYIWYKDKTFQLIVALEAIIGILFSGGIWIVDHQITPDPLYFFGIMIILTVGLSWLFRNNP